MAVSKSPRTVWLAAVVLLLVVATACWWKFHPVGQPIAPDNGGKITEKLTSQDVRHLIEQKDLGLGYLENERFAESDGPLLELSGKLPNEAFGPRNLVIARLLRLEKLNRTQNPEKFAATVTQAESAIERLNRIRPDDVVTHLLAARLARIQRDADRTLRELRRAIELRPDDIGALWELFDASEKSRDPAQQKTGRRALGRAFEKNPDNLWLLIHWVKVQAEIRDIAIVSTLQKAKTTIGPFVTGIKKRTRFDLGKMIDETINAVGEKNWKLVRRNAGYLNNLMKSEVATLLDFRRTARHPLEYVILDFSPTFYEQAKLPPPSPPSAVPIKLVPAKTSLSAMGDVRAVRLEDFDLDGRPDMIAVQPRRVAVFRSGKTAAGWKPICTLDLPMEVSGLVVVDLDRDFRDNPNFQQVVSIPKNEGKSGRDSKPKPSGRKLRCHNSDVDLIVFGPGGIAVLRNEFDRKTKKRSLQPVKQDAKFAAIKKVTAAAAADVDHDGDLDIVCSSDHGLTIWSNRGNLTFEEITDRSVLPPPEMQFTSLVPVDFNRDVSIDILACGPSAASGILENTLHGRFRWRAFDKSYKRISPARILAVDDVDANVSWDILSGGKKGIAVIRTRTPNAGVIRFLSSATLSESPVAGLVTWDFDNDGFLDILAWNENEMTVLRAVPGGSFQPVKNLISSPPKPIYACDVADIDDDGDLDLIVATSKRLLWYRNDGGNANHAVDIVIRADEGPNNPSQRCNMHGIGSLMELKSFENYQPRVVSRQITHFGLGKATEADVVRILWTNGIAQNVLKPRNRQPICAQQKLKGSCPYLYTWTGSRYEFLTDCLWAAPIGLQFAEGVLAPAREWEYLKIPGERLRPIDGEYRLQLTEELWEAAYFDSVKLLVIDHPADVEIYSNEKVGPAEVAKFQIHTVRHSRKPVAAHDQRGRDVLPLLTAQDGNFLKAFDQQRTQGFAEPHFVELDFGRLENPQKIMLFLTGWIFPTDTSLNIALSQNPQRGRPQPPSLWVPDGKGNWKNVVPYMGFPGGKTKTIAVDLSGKFPTNDYRVQIRTSMELYWDAAFFTVDELPADYHRADLKVAAADLHYRGFSRWSRSPGHGPDRYHYNRVITEPLWPPMRGGFTRYGNVTDLLRTIDDRLVVLGAGDEVTLRFKVPAAGPPPGWTRDFLLYNVGWDKDADLNSVYGQTVEPLPFKGMVRYPYPVDRPYPNTPRHRRYLQTWQTRTQPTRRFWRAVRDFRVANPNSGKR